MCTGNLRSASELYFRYTTDKERKYLFACLHYLAVIFIFVIGAAAGTVITKHLTEKAVWIACIALALVLVLMIIRPDEHRKDNN